MMSESMTTIAVIIRESAVYSMANDAGFGESLSDAIKRHLSTRRPELFRAGRRGEIAGRVIAADSNTSDLVIVAREQMGYRVAKDRSASQATFDALVDVLRAHGYTCRKGASR